MLTLYGVPVSPYCRKVQLAFAHKEIEYTLKHTVPGSDDPEFVQASPLKKVPAIRTKSGFAFPDSSVIIAWAEKTHPENPLYPEDPEALARALWLEELADTKLMEATAALYFQRIIGPTFFARPVEDARVKELVSEVIPAQLNLLETQLPESGWLVNDTLTVADIATGAALINLDQADFEVDARRWPRTAAFLNRFRQLDITRRQLESENAVLNMARNTQPTGE